jgi:hypothetical protein
VAGGESVAGCGCLAGRHVCGMQQGMPSKAGDGWLRPLTARAMSFSIRLAHPTPCNVACMWTHPAAAAQLTHPNHFEPWLQVGKPVENPGGEVQTPRS